MQPITGLNSEQSTHGGCYGSYCGKYKCDIHINTVAEMRMIIKIISMPRRSSGKYEPNPYT
jgi:hypothetical protein